MMDLTTVAVFGGSGKMGRHLLRVLERRGLRIRALVHRAPVEAEGLTAIHGSVSDRDAVAEVVQGADAVVQLATTKEEESTFFDVSIRGTFHILEACRPSTAASRRHHEPLKQFILFGGDAAMGIWFHPQPIPIDENHPRAAYPGYYAFSKVIEEVMTEQYAAQYGVPVSILRSSWVFEDDDLLDHFSLLRNVDPAEKGHGFGEVGEDILALVEAGEERILVLVDAEGVPLRRHIVHVDDVMQAFGKMLGNPAALGQSFNIAAPAPFDYRVAAGYLSSKMGIPVVEVRCPDYHPFEINITRARSVLGYAPENDFFRMADRALGARAARGP